MDPSAHMPAEPGAPQPPPWPALWSAPNCVGALLAAAFFAAVAVLSAAVLASRLVSHHVDRHTLLLVPLIPIGCGLAATYAALRLGVRSRSTGSVRCVQTGDGPGCALSVPFLWSLSAALTLVGAGMASGLLLLAVTSGLSAFADGSVQILPLMICAVLVSLAIPTLGLLIGLAIDVLRGRPMRGELLLSPQVIEYRTLGYTAWMAWDMVHSVSAVAGDGQRIVIAADSDVPTRIERRSWWLRPSRAVLAQADEALLLIRGVSLSIDPALAFHLLRHYHARPAARAELGSETAVQRICSGNASSGG